MAKQFISIVEIPSLNEIFNEINYPFSLKIFNFENTSEFLDKIKSKNLEISDSLIISKKNNLQLLSTINVKELILLDNEPIKILSLIEKINIALIKKKYNYQSELFIKKYKLDLNSRTISYQKDNLKLTEREIDIILFLKDRTIPQSVKNLQNEVWKYSSTMETHTVETHIYRLRKKIKDKFNDDEFIFSLKNGYKI